MNVNVPVHSRSERIELIGRVLNLRARHDYPALEACFTPDAIFWLIGRRAYIPFAGKHLGRAAMTAALRRMDSEIEYLGFGNCTPVVDGDRAAVRWQARVRNLGTGAEVRMKGFAHLVFSHNLISEFTYFLDTRVIAELVSRE